MQCDRETDVPITSQQGNTVIVALFNSNEIDPSMKNFSLGLLLGIVISLPIGVNLGKGVPLLSNPFASASDNDSRDGMKQLRQVALNIQKQVRSAIAEQNK